MADISLHYAVFSDHALTEMERRNIQKELVIQIIKNPDSVHPMREGRAVLQKTFIADDLGKALLYRVFVDVDRTPPVIVTVYRTSKIAKYETTQ